MIDKINQIMQADCIEYLKSLPSACVEAVIIDEPYGVLEHKIEDGYNLDIGKQVRIEIMRVLKKDGWFVFFGQFPTGWDFGRITMEVGLQPWQGCNEIVWCKRVVSSPFGKISRIHENIFIWKKGNPQTYENKAPYEDIIIPSTFNGITSEEGLKRYVAVLQAQAKGGPVRIIEGRSQHNDNIYQAYGKAHAQYQEKGRIPSIWSFAKENLIHRNAHNIRHPTVKPTLLLRRLIKLFTQKGDTILDCFVGSGTTAIACLQEGRNFLACDKDPTYIKIANERLKNWEADLLRQEQWLNARNVRDFESDAEKPTNCNSQLELFKVEQK